LTSPKVAGRPLKDVLLERRTRKAGSRTSAFGLLDKPLESLVRGIDKSLKEIRHEQCLAAGAALKGYPLKRLRNSLFTAMSLDTALQPIAAIDRKYNPDKKAMKNTVIPNPIWEKAPSGAYLKARKVCNLVTQICLFYTGKTSLLHDLERLAINIWRMSKRHFMGLLKSIRAKLAQGTNCALKRKSPEARELGKLTRNPLSEQQRVFLHTRCKTSQFKHTGCASKRLSTKVDLAISSLWCTKCTVATPATWFYPHRR